MIAEWKQLNSQQRSAFVTAFLGWTLDAFDFFIMIFVMSAIATEFHSTVKAVTVGVTLTLMMRPVGAFVFGALADKYGRKPILMIDIILFSVLELASGFAPSLTVLLILRAAFGFAMGGEWGIGSSLTMETIPASARGLASGVIQEGYACGHLLAAAVYGLFFPMLGWRGMFMVGVLPALLVLYIRRNVEESPVWKKVKARPKRPLLPVIRQNWKLFVYVVILMTAFNFFSHGTQDAYPTFMQTQMHYDHHVVSTIEIFADIGAILSGIFFGRLSQRIGRRKAIVFAALFALPVIPLWAFGRTAVMLGLGSFLVRVSVQGAWGIIPVHLNELSPDEVRGTFPGFAYQLGNFFASANLTIQAWMAERNGGDYRPALATVAAAAAIAIALLTSFGVEKHGVEFGAEATVGE